MRRSVWCAFVVLFVSVPSFGQVLPELYAGMKWREIGPFRGGRSCAVTGVEGRPNEFYFGATGGGVWKSTDAGENWKNVSDGFFKTGSVGAIEVSPSNPDVVYVGMGETEIRGNISHGDGVYRSNDGGTTWTHLGLASTQTISRVRIHPKNPDIAWVAALGHIYGPHPDRGIYKTIDGGKTWKKTLFVDDRSGAVDLTVDRQNPSILYAATWTAWRTPHSLNSGGPGSKLWKSTNGGDTWIDMTNNIGLPKAPHGKMGVAVSAIQPNRVWAMIESAQGGLYRSDDGGATWKLINAGADMRQRPWYYTRVYADPKAADTVYVLNVAMHRSTNGGTSFSSMVAGHSDHHDLWIDPADPKRLISGNDGGAAVSVNSGSVWTEQDQATAQFYHDSTDNFMPYRIYGAQQDNSSIRIASRTFGAGIGRADWTATAGGESGYVVAKPNDPEIVYGGNYGGDLEMRDHRSNQNRAVDPWPDNPMGAGADGLVHRMQWTFPIVFSPHDPETMYTCSQHVFRSKDGGGSWDVISPDLTTNDKARQQSSGGPITKDNTGVEYYCTVFTLAESPKRRGVLWAGSDDGLVHLSMNGGGQWSKVTPKDMPKFSLCSMIDASTHDSATAFLAVDNHENDDYRPYIFITRDFGKTWRNSVTGLPVDAQVRVVREDLKQPGLLYCGTETGAYVSFDFGQRWQPLQMNLPIVPIHDLAVKDNDLIAATHGRSFWVLDDLAPIRDLAARRSVSSSEPVLFASSPGFQWAGGGGGGGRPRGAAPELMGPNPPNGLVVSAYLPQSGSSVKLEMIDGTGVVVATLSPTGTKGLNRWSLIPRYPGFVGFSGLRMWAAGSSPIKAPPGRYKVRMTVDGRALETTVAWTKDPRSPASEKELVAQFQLSQKIAARTTEANQTVVAIRELRSKVQTAIQDNVALETEARPLLAAIQSVEEAIYQTKAQSGQDFLNYPIRLNNKLAALIGHVQSGNYGPTKQAIQVFTHLSKQLDAQLDVYRQTLEKDLGRLNAALKAAGAQPIEVKK